MTTPTSPSDQTLPSPAELLALADRVEARKEGGMTVPGNRTWLYAEALRALAREKRRG